LGEFVKNSLGLPTGNGGEREDNTPSIAMTRKRFGQWGKLNKGATYSSRRASLRRKQGGETRRKEDWRES